MAARSITAEADLALPSGLPHSAVGGAVWTFAFWRNLSNHRERLCRLSSACERKCTREEEQL